ncbi:NUDIX hydrolase [Gracilibacillus oryzae]|uniref:NUDIX hydrolase n=1 Tax=Gracilibacillus oryzae TaxID=1672701 RepID=A0A7C8KT26_9BACI|nr:NUDIX hydrolase [Gracilibacillus oryzae]KAB8138079.1 NUDIX hydrolase [Gracilibacillus oryzae]
MEKWRGSAGVCINESGKLLMVLQGKPDERKTWSVPSGGCEGEETFAACCVREVWEETGYMVEMEEKIKVKNGSNPNIPIDYEVHYFSVKIIGGKMQIQDPDKLIHEIAWKTMDEIKELELSFPEDLEFLAEWMLQNSITS